MNTVHPSATVRRKGTVNVLRCLVLQPFSIAGFHFFPKRFNCVVLMSRVPVPYRQQSNMIRLYMRIDSSEYSVPLSYLSKVATCNLYARLLADLKVDSALSARVSKPQVPTVGISDL